MKNLIAIFLFSFSSYAAFSQTYYTISGKIIDQETKLPLQGASVFAENTTIGTATDIDGIFHLQLPNGGYSLVITFTGYQTETKRITTGDADNNNILMDLKKKEKSLDEFVVKATYEVADGLAKYGDFFIENFIGKTANAQQCSIENKEALKFYYYKRKKRLKILATEPLKIINNALGYTIKYELDSFVHEYNTDISLYSGYPLFQEMETSSMDQLVKWNAARTESYNGSILHFMRSMYNKKLKEEGFEIQFVVKKNDTETALTLKDFYQSVNYKIDDSTNTVDILPNQRDVAIIYKNEEPSALYAQANPDDPNKFELSVVNFLPNESLDIEQNGFYYEQNDITITGYWAWEKVADMLPYDF
ncbi:MAG TPA: carboxypeptidase-like regulatory domain-containing protein, partial [Ferruginibacter sp.]|nr:carboxypeptidase-like regulatory domain-containing protein [Ferruginibacter sp.]